ncbi:MAG: 50S ribosomal protein L17 [Alphaproteobacteria bacterium]|nr:50S ribosomal protein L17 [Alphaproteobacteria bacterium]
MRHRKSGRKFDTNAPHRKAMFRNMVTALMVHGQIKTTTQRAKELRRVADKVISLGKRAPSAADIDAMKDQDAQRQARADRVAAIRRAKLWVNDDAALGMLFGEYAERYRTRPGGYTRILKAGFRAGDNAEMAVIQLVEELEAKAEEPKKKAAKKASTKAADEEATVAMDDAPADADEGEVVE